MNKRQTLDYMKAIAEMKSISVAAENLGISQPALSSFLKKKEAELGTLLFDRSKQPIELTESGKAYLDYLDRAVALDKELEHNIADLEDLKTGRLSVGGASFFNVSYIPEAVVKFAEKYPGIELEIVDGKVPELIASAQKGLLDLFITPIADDEDRFHYEKLLEEDIYIAVPENWEVNAEIDSDGEMTEEDFNKLCDYPFIMLKRDQHLGMKMEELFKRYGRRPKHMITAEQTMTTLVLTMAGVGISLISGSSIKNVNVKNRPALYIADRDICRRSIYVAYPKNMYMSKATKTFIRMLKEVHNTEKEL